MRRLLIFETSVKSAEQETIGYPGRVWLYLLPMPPRRQSSGPSSLSPNLLDGLLRLVGLFFADSGAGGRQKAASFSFGVIVLCVVFTGGWYLFQPTERKHEIGHLVANYSQQHKRIKVTEVLWDIWTLYFSRPFVSTSVQAGQGSVFAGEPVRTSFPHNLRVLHNIAYTVGYCDDLADPAWVCYRVFDLQKHVAPPKRPEGFFMDTRTSARVEPGDYTSSGYDRGHMAPNFAIGTRYGAQAQEETFLMSNVCPQRHRLNAGLWKDMELRIADNYTGRFGQVWVIDGPVFGPEDRLRRLRNKVPVPEAFYMVIIQQHEGGVRAEGIVIDQEAPSGGSLDNYAVSIADIEHRTGLNFFPKLEAGAQKQLEAQTAGSLW